MAPLPSRRGCDKNLFGDQIRILEAFHYMTTFHERSSIGANLPRENPEGIDCPFAHHPLGNDFENAAFRSILDLQPFCRGRF